MKLNLEIIGYLLVILALSHMLFPKYFKWKSEFMHLSLINRQMFYVHTLFIALVVLLMGLLCITSSDEIITTGLGKRISLGLGIFWLTRLIIQLFGYSPKLWKGKSFETLVHIVFTFLWSYISWIFLWIYIN